MKHIEFFIVSFAIIAFTSLFFGLFIALVVNITGNVYACSLVVTVLVILALAISVGLIADKYQTTYKGV